MKLGVTSSKAICYHVSLTDANFHKPGSDFYSFELCSYDNSLKKGTYLFYKTRNADL